MPHNAAVAESALSVFAEMDTSDIRGLLMRVPPPDTTVQCYIVRKKGAMGMFASYKLYLQENVTAGPGHMVTLRPPESVFLRFASSAQRVLMV